MVGNYEELIGARHFKMAETVSLPGAPFLKNGGKLT
jgi:hypothetical protein